MKAREVSTVNSDTVSEHAPSTPRFVHAPTVCSPESPTPTAPWPGLSLWILLCGPWPRNDTLACVSPSPLALQETLEALSPERPPRSPPRSHRSRRRGFAAAAPGSGARPPDHPRFTRDLPRCTRDVPEVAREVSGSGKARATIFTRHRPPTRRHTHTHTAGVCHHRWPNKEFHVRTSL